MSEAGLYRGFLRPLLFLFDPETAHYLAMQMLASMSAIPMLLRPLHRGMALGALMDAWKVPIGSKPAIADWLLKHRVLRRHHPRNRIEEGCCGQA